MVDRDHLPPGATADPAAGGDGSGSAEKGWGTRDRAPLPEIEPPPPEPRVQANYDFGHGAAAVREAQRDLPPQTHSGNDPAVRASGPRDHVPRSSGDVGSPTGDDVGGPETDRG